MKNGTCPKCSGREIYHRAGSRFSQELVELKGGVINQGAAPDKYLCAACGYLEYYLPLSDEQLAVVRDNWERVVAQ